MTREEAKEILNEIKILDDSMYQYNKMYLQALDMAIEALEQETAPFDFELYQAGLMDISERITNGDIIKTMFPNSQLHKESDYVYLTIQNGVYLEDRNGNWWNTLYKKENEEQTNADSD